MFPTAGNQEMVVVFSAGNAGPGAVRKPRQARSDGSAPINRATDAREKGRIGITGTGFSYSGASGRVTSETLGRDLNPLGRGDGREEAGGAGG